MKETSSARKTTHQIARPNRELRYVPLGKMRIAPYAQRDLKEAWVDHLFANFEPEQLGALEVSERDGYFYIMDGRHRFETLKRWLGEGWEEQQIQCWVAIGLTEKDEAETFLRLNDVLAVNVFDKFRIALRALRPVETEINRVVVFQNLNISKQAVPGAISCVGTLRRVYLRDGREALASALRIARDAYGDAGLAAPVIDGLGLLCHRYNGVLDETAAIKALASAHGGVNGLLNIAEQLRQKTGNAKQHCVAGAAVEIINRSRAAKRLPSWWKDGNKSAVALARA